MTKSLLCTAGADRRQGVSALSRTQKRKRARDAKDSQNRRMRVPKLLSFNFVHADWSAKTPKHARVFGTFDREFSLSPIQTDGGHSGNSRKVLID